MAVGAPDHEEAELLQRLDQRIERAGLARAQVAAGAEVDVDRAHAAALAVPAVRVVRVPGVAAELRVAFCQTLKPGLEEEAERDHVSGQTRRLADLLRDLVPLVVADRGSRRYGGDRSADRRCRRRRAEREPARARPRARPPVDLLGVLAQLLSLSTQTRTSAPSIFGGLAGSSRPPLRSASRPSAPRRRPVDRAMSVVPNVAHCSSSWRLISRAPASAAASAAVCACDRRIAALPIWNPTMPSARIASSSITRPGRICPLVPAAHDRRAVTAQVRGPSWAGETQLCGWDLPGPDGESMVGPQCR